MRHSRIQRDSTRRLLDEFEDLEHREVHGDDDASDYAAHYHDHYRLDDPGARLDGGVHLGLVALRNLAQHAVHVAGLVADGDHSGDHRREDGLAFERLVDGDALPDRIPAP